MSEHPNGPSTHDDTVARLLRQAGHRTAVPAVHHETAKVAARAVWRSAVESERRRRRVYWRGAGGLLAAAALVAVALNLGLAGRLVRLAPTQAAQLATITRTEGALRAGDRLLEAGAAIHRGETIRARDGRAALRLEGGVAVRLDSGTELTITSVDHLRLLAGTIFVDTDGVPSGVPEEGRIEIDTAYGTVVDIGTRFEVRLRAASDGDGRRLEVQVRDGAVEVEGTGGARHRAEAGERLTVDAAGAVTRGTTATCGETWSWADGLVPTFDGHGYLAFTAWAARQGGFTLRQSSAELGVLFGEAADGMISGIEGLPLADQLGLAFGESQGFAYRIEGCALVIEAVEKRRAR